MIRVMNMHIIMLTNRRLTVVMIMMAIYIVNHWNNSVITVRMVKCVAMLATMLTNKATMSDR